MDRSPLKDPDVIPVNEVLQPVLGETFPVYKNLIEIITSENYELEPQWNYYIDGKAWLCKVTFKKKTVFWLSVWDQYFKVAFYFTEKHVPGIASLGLDAKIMEDFSNQKPIGKLLPLVITITSQDQLTETLRIVALKKALK